MKPMLKKLAIPLLSVMLLPGSIFAGDNGASKENLVTVITPSMQELKQFTVEHPALSVGLFAFLLAEIRFWTRDPDRLPSRCDLSRLKSSDVNWNDVWNVVDDGIIGQQYKSESLKVIDGKVVASTLKLPKGVLGYIHTYWGPVLQAVGTTYFVYLMERAIVDKDSKGILSYLQKNNKEMATAIAAYWLGKLGSVSHS